MDLVLTIQRVLRFRLTSITWLWEGVVQRDHRIGLHPGMGARNRGAESCGVRARVWRTAGLRPSDRQTEMGVQEE